MRVIDYPEYRVWRSMKDRCFRAKSSVFKYYGGRGITVCDRWCHSFYTFLSDMGRAEGRTLDRIDNDGPYSPENCRWATRHEQAQNKRNNRYVDVDGRRVAASEAARLLGIAPWTILRRLDANLPPDSRPPQRLRKTHCKQGHPFSGENLYIRPNGAQKCRACAVVMKARWKQKRDAQLVLSH
jgi:hypothetical protein